MTWRVANSLIKLREQINIAYPNRSKASDGTIGDPNHQAEGNGSDHNPNKLGVVCAFDITHDPANGLDIVKLSQALADSRDARIKYLIRNSQILVPADYGWSWQPYYGSNPHTSHLHVSVYGDYDNESKWNIGGQEMVSDKGVEYLFRTLLGRAPDKKQKAELMKNYTFDQLETWILSLPEYADNLVLLREGKIDTKKFLVYPWNKTTTTPAQTVQQLKPGIYEVK